MSKVIDGAPHVAFDHRGRASLDGIWEFFPAEHRLEDLESQKPEAIAVPALWEAQGYLELDGIAWYRRRFSIEGVPTYCTLHFGAVMDVADVYLNGEHLGTHSSPFTPFSFDVSHLLRDGDNELLVRVFDPPVDHPEHIRMTHGKQGWANWVFPSRPSLYMTYGGIWQSVTLNAHGPLALDDVFVNSDPDDLTVSVAIRNVSDVEVRGELSIRTLGLIAERDVVVPPRGCRTFEAALGATPAPRWTPEDPVLHDLLVDVVVDERPSDARESRFGLRTVALEGTTMLINDIPFRMKSVLVQGFRADGLYDEGSREEIEREVLAARAMGFNMLRLHIKAFDPRYLDVCDELGMLLHCDLPVAEPIAHEEMGRDTLLARRCVEAIYEQVRRDRNHPSIVLWSAMNELCWDRQEARDWPGYEEFARTLMKAVTDLDTTRPVIENDWPEPDPDRVFLSPILTAHWYGRLHRAYLDKIEHACEYWKGTGKPLYVTEFGDWGLPDMPSVEDAPFWDTRAVYAAGLASTRWPASIERFVVETQRYQGLSDRLQIEVFRRHDHIGGYCLTELTDVPHELNGLLDMHRNPKETAVREVARANQTVLPMLELDSLVVEAGSVLRAHVHVANDGGALRDATIEVRFADAGDPIELDRLLAAPASDLPLAQITSRFEEEHWACRVGEVPAYRAVPAGEMLLTTPTVPGSHDLVVRLSDGRRQVAENRYPIHVVARPPAFGGIRLIAGDEQRRVLESLGAEIGDSGPLVIGESAMTPEASDAARATIADGGCVLVLAQPRDHAASYPIPVSITPVETAWGSSVFHFTTDEGALASFPRRTVLVAEDSTIQATTVISEVEGGPFPTIPLVIAFKPTPGAITGTIVGEHAIGDGRLVFCQYRLVAQASRGDAAARALLGDLVGHARAPRRAPHREVLTKPDGRTLTLYSFEEDA